MKKSLFIFFAMLLASISLHVKANQVMYVYRSDSAIDAFYTYEIDSITYSYYDLDSVLHDTCQVQEIWTYDSIYRLPLSIIDSVSFITPQTVYMPEVVDISDNLMNYVISSDIDSLRILLQLYTPSGILPQVGTKIVTTEMNEKFPIGFMGKVENVILTDSGYVVDCSRLSLTEIFDTYYSYTSAYGDTEETESAAPNKVLSWANHGEQQFNIPTLSWTPIGAGFSTEILPGLARNYGSEMKISLTPRFHVRAFLSVTRGVGAYFSTSVIGELDLEESCSISGGVSYQLDIPFTKLAKYAIAPLIFVYYEPGIVLNLGAQISLSAIATQTFKFSGVRDWSNNGKNVLKPALTLQLHKHNISIEGSIDGSVGLGIYSELGICALDADLGSVKFRAEAGSQLQGGIVLFQADLEQAHINTNFYDMCKDGKIEWNLYHTNSISAEVGKQTTTLVTPNTETIKLREWNIVPTFENTSFVSNSDNEADASVEMRGDCLVPVSVGLSVRDEKKNEIETYYANQKFDNGHKSFKHTFSNLSDDKNYSVYPMVKMLGFDIMANPSAELEIHEFVKISNFVVTDSAYDADKSFVYNGEHYSYKYNCAVTVELNMEGTEAQVLDWGYAYIDPNNDTAYISLANYTSPYTDTRYVYYRNESKSSVTLKGYVILAGDDERKWSATKVFHLNYNTLICSGDDHPHMVDLGLSSGTLWACMNIGASKPEDIGDYFAYAETSPKNNYTQNSYLYFEYNGGYSYYTSLGTADISGTVYDAARVNWHDDWRMPTTKEIQELLDSCTWTWTSRNSVEGYEVTGSNGNSIFLPFAPVKNGTSTGSVCYYRSSLFNSESYGNVFNAGSDAIKFLREQAPSKGSVLRFMGAVIRPVKTKP